MKISFPPWSMLEAGNSPSTERKPSIVDFVIEGSLSNLLFCLQRRCLQRRMPKMMTDVLSALGAVEDASADRGKGNCLIEYPP